MTDEIKYDIEEIEERKKYAIDNFNDNKLEWYLNVLSKSELISICKKLLIKGYSSKNKSEIIKLIIDTYFKDYELLEKMLKTYHSGFKVVLDQVTNQKKNYIIFHHDVPDDVFLFYAEGSELLFIPVDVKEHFNQYKKHNKNYSSEMQTIKFYRSAFNLYGFMTFEHLVELKKQFFNIETSVEVVKKEIVELLPEYESLISGDSIKHIELKNIELDLDSLTKDKNYYVPNKLEEYMRYSERFYIEENDAINELKMYLEEGISQKFKGTDTASLIVNTIIFGLRANDKPDQIMKHIDNIEKSGFVSFKDKSTLKQKIEKALYHTRIWVLNGYTFEEVEGIIKLVHPDELGKQESKNKKTDKLLPLNKNKKKPVQVKRKTNKRGKNRNIAHVTKLDDYRKK